MCFDGAFRTPQTARYCFDGEIVIVVEHKAATTRRCEAFECLGEPVSQLLAEEVSARTHLCVYETVFRNEMQRAGVVFLPAEMVSGDILGDAVKPRGEGSLASERVDASQRLQPRLLCQVLCGLRVLDAAGDVTQQAGVVFDNKQTKRVGVAVLRALDEGLFVKGCRHMRGDRHAGSPTPRRPTGFRIEECLGGKT